MKASSWTRLALWTCAIASVLCIATYVLSGKPLMLASGILFAAATAGNAVALDLWKSIDL